MAISMYQFCHRKNFGNPTAILTTNTNIYESAFYNIKATAANMGFCASRAGRSNFGCLHRCTLVRAGRNSVGLLVVILYFYFFIGLQFRAGQTTMPCLHKALFVMRYQPPTLGYFEAFIAFFLRIRLLINRNKSVIDRCRSFSCDIPTRK